MLTPSGAATKKAEDCKATSDNGIATLRLDVFNNINLSRNVNDANGIYTCTKDTNPCFQFKYLQLFTQYPYCQRLGDNKTKYKIYMFVAYHL